MNGFILAVGSHTLAKWRSINVDLKQCYVILDVNIDASLAEVKIVYRDLAQVWHPDRFQNSPRLQAKAAEQMKQVNAAYEALTKHLSSAAPVAPIRPRRRARTTNVHQTSVDLTKAQSYYSMGAVHYDAKNYPDAITNFQLAIHFHPRFEKALEGLAKSLCFSNRNEEGVSVWRQLLSLNPNNSSAHMGMAWTYKIYAAQSDSNGDDLSRTRFLKQALTEFKQYIRVRPEVPDGYHGLGDTYSDMEAFPEAIEAYKQVVRLDATYDGIYSDIGYAYLAIDDYASAIEYFQQEIRAARYNISGNWSSLGMAYQYNGWFEQAIDAYRKALQISPTDAHAHLGLGETYLAVHNKTAALEVHKALQRLDPKKASMLFQKIFA